MRLRVKTSTGKSAVLTGIEQETTADNFRKLLHESVDEHPEADMRILVGFPPKQFSLKGDTQLGNAVQDGDVVVVDAGVCEDKKKRPKRRRRATFEEQVDFLEQSRFANCTTSAVLRIVSASSHICSHHFVPSHRRSS